MPSFVLLECVAKTKYSINQKYLKKKFSYVKLLFCLIVKLHRVIQWDKYNTFGDIYLTQFFNIAKCLKMVFYYLQFACEMDLEGFESQASKDYHTNCFVSYSKAFYNSKLKADLKEKFFNS